MKTVEKPVDGQVGLTYIAWPHKTLKRYPITKKHIGVKVLIAENSTNDKTYLEKIHQPGENMWPRGGYTIRDRNLNYPIKCFPDMVIAKPPKTKKARSKLAKKIRDGNTLPHVISQEYWNPPKMDGETKIKEVQIYSTDMTAKAAKNYIKNTSMKKLEGFVPKDENRKTVQKAWEIKNRKNRDKVSTDMKALEAAKFIKNSPTKNLLGFIGKGESRKTVKKAWENKLGI